MKRSGVTIIETTIAMAILAVVITTSIQALVGVAAVRRANQQRLLAQQEAANLMEQLFAVRWEDLNDDTAASLQLSAEAAKRLRGAKLKVTLARPDDELAPIQIRIEISWPDHTSQTTKPVKLVALRYRLGDA